MIFKSPIVKLVVICCRFSCFELSAYKPSATNSQYQVKEFKIKCTELCAKKSKPNYCYNIELNDCQSQIMLQNAENNQLIMINTKQ